MLAWGGGGGVFFGRGSVEKFLGGVEVGGAGGFFQGVTECRFLAATPRFVPLPILPASSSLCRDTPAPPFILGWYPPSKGRFPPPWTLGFSQGYMCVPPHLNSQTGASGGPPQQGGAGMGFSILHLVPASQGGRAHSASSEHPKGCMTSPGPPPHPQMWAQGCRAPPEAMARLNY